jgi:glycosyltransferase involved in cell wall biosynthesis
VDIARLQAEDGPLILAVLHGLGGGTNRHVLELAHHLRGKARFLTLKPESDHCVSLRLASENEGFDLHFFLDDRRDAPGETGVRNADAHDGVRNDYAALVSILRTLGVCHVHFHHRIGHALAVLDLPRQLNVGYDYTLHDYFPICPRITLTHAVSQTYCGEQGVAQCQACLPNGSDIVAWRNGNAALIHDARFLIAPSRDALARLLRYIPAAPARLSPLPHTDLDPRTPLPGPRPPRLEGDRPLKVAVIGALNLAKGAQLLEETAIAAQETGAPVEFHLLGYALRPLTTVPHARLTVYGRYAEADLPALLNWLQPDVIWFPALWPETYCYTLSACLQGGWPVAAPDIGAFPERLTGRAWSWLKPWGTPAAGWLDFFTAIRQRHYRTGQPPAPPLPALPDLPPFAQPGLPSRDWYAGPYLAELPRISNAVSEPTPELRALIAAHMHVIADDTPKQQKE